jgi:hypothetical protein
LTVCPLFAVKAKTGDAPAKIRNAVTTINKTALFINFVFFINYLLILVKLINPVSSVYFKISI